jgi:hypothetical protein
LKVSKVSNLNGADSLRTFAKLSKMSKVRRGVFGARLREDTEGAHLRNGCAPSTPSTQNRRECDYGLPVIDAREWMGEEDFIDGHHLLPDGAAAFTRRFGAEALAPVFAGCRPGG